MFPKPITVESLDKYHIALKYDDGTAGTVDLSNLAHQGVFEEWEKNNLFSKVYIDSETQTIAWNDELDICPDALYLRLIGMSFEDYKSLIHATD
jgi:hypothetical protein